MKVEVGVMRNEGMRSSGRKDMRSGVNEECGENKKMKVGEMKEIREGKVRGNVGKGSKVVKVDERRESRLNERT